MSCSRFAPADGAHRVPRLDPFGLFCTPPLLSEDLPDALTASDRFSILLAHGWGARAAYLAP